MNSAAGILVCVLHVLGRGAGELPPVVLVDTAPRGSSPQVEAFVREGEPVIHLVTSSAVFRRAQQVACSGEHDAFKKLASIIVHEEVHVRSGPDERPAYEAQLIMLMRLGALPGSATYESVRRAMTSVVASKSARMSVTQGRASGPPPL